MSILLYETTSIAGKSQLKALKNVLNYILESLLGVKTASNHIKWKLNSTKFTLIGINHNQSFTSTTDWPTDWLTVISFVLKTKSFVSNGQLIKKFSFHQKLRQNIKNMNNKVHKIMNHNSYVC